MASNPRVHPVVNQIEVHPFNTQTAIRETCARHNIVVEAYAPLARAMRMRHPKIVELARQYSCTPAQLFVRWGAHRAVPRDLGTVGFHRLTWSLRWSLQHNMVTLPKSAKRDRLIQNVQVNGFEISEADMAAMDDLDENLVTDW